MKPWADAQTAFSLTGGIVKPRDGLTLQGRQPCDVSPGVSPRAPNDLFRLIFQGDRRRLSFPRKISLPFFGNVCLYLRILIRPGGAFGQSPQTLKQDAMDAPVPRGERLSARTSEIVWS